MPLVRIQYRHPVSGSTCWLYPKAMAIIGNHTVTQWQLVYCLTPHILSFDFWISIFSYFLLKISRNCSNTAFPEEMNINVIVCFVLSLSFHIIIKLDPPNCSRSLYFILFWHLHLYGPPWGGERGNLINFEFQSFT